MKEVDAAEVTLRCWQEIYDEEGTLVEIHEKYPVGQRSSTNLTVGMGITRQSVAEKIAAYLRGEITHAALIDWAETAVYHAELEPLHAGMLMGVLTKLAGADVEGYGILWEDCAQMLKDLGYIAHIEILADR